MRKFLYEILDEDLTPGEVLRGLRIKANISQEQMESITKIRRSNISALENDRLDMTAHYAEIFGAVFDIHPKDLLYPNKNLKKSEEVISVEKRAIEFFKKRA